MAATERDVWRTAERLIDTYGEQAPSHALGSSTLFFDRGDLLGAGEWRRVSLAATQLLRRSRSAGEAMH
jgi:hypothetical protein